MEYLSHSAEETERIAYDLAAEIEPPCVICLFGDLGAGKTAFVRGFARRFGVTEGVCSPTFIIMHCYSGAVQINHYDLYRIGSFEELEDIGFDEQISSGISLIEWPDSFIDCLPEERIDISITRSGDDENPRRITVKDLRRVRKEQLS